MLNHSDFAGWRLSGRHALCDVRHTVRARARALLRFTRKLCALPLTKQFFRTTDVKHVLAEFLVLDEPVVDTQDTSS